MHTKVSQMRESRAIKVINRVLPGGMGSLQKSLPEQTCDENDDHYSWTIPESQRAGGLGDLVEQIKDYQLTHSSMIKLVRTTEGPTVLSRPIGVSVYPTPFPWARFEAIGLQKAYNKLYARIVEDTERLEQALRPLIDTDPFTCSLWDIHKEASRYQAETISLEHQPITLGIFQSDYMLHQPDETTVSSASPSFQTAQLKQVEFNTFSVAGGAHGHTAGRMHAHLSQYNNDGTSHLHHLPANDTTPSLVSALADAHAAYGPSRSGHPLAVLMLVQPHNVNACDERPLEYGLWERTPPVECHRLVFGAPVLHRTTLGPGGVLVYKLPGRGRGGAREISVVYFRAGYEAREYVDDADGIAARFFVEKSRAIKCPSVLGHLATFKAVQRALAEPGAVERFLGEDEGEVAAVRRTFAPMYTLDGRDEEGMKAMQLVRDGEGARGYVLKPSLEGGGNNVYGEEIPGFLKGVEEGLWKNYVLMELMRPPVVSNTLMGPRGLYQGNVVSELGVFGVVMWERKGKRGARDGKGDVEILKNENAGWSFKTKAAHVNEMSVIKGYGCFDCPALVD